MSFDVKISDIEPNITREQEREIALLTLSMFDNDWVHCIASIKSRYNLESESIQNTLSKLGKLRDCCGGINNNRVSRWQGMYFDWQKSQDETKKRTD